MMMMIFFFQEIDTGLKRRPRALRPNLVEDNDTFVEW